MRETGGPSTTVPQYRNDLEASYDNLGNVLERFRPTRGGRASSSSGRRTLEKLVAESPSVVAYQSVLAVSNAHLAMVLLKEHRQADQAYRRAIRIAENLTEPEAENELAWALATTPSPQIQDLQLAVRLARKAVEQAAESGGYWNTLGVAHYRVGDWKAATEALQKSMQPQRRRRCLPTGSSWPWPTGAWERRIAARPWYDKAADWMEKNKSQDAELRRFRGEAATLLGVTDRPKTSSKKEEEQLKAYLEAVSAGLTVEPGPQNPSRHRGVRVQSRRPSILELLSSAKGSHEPRRSRCAPGPWPIDRIPTSPTLPWRLRPCRFHGSLLSSSSVVPQLRGVSRR